MVSRNTFHTFLSLILIVPMMLFVSLGACSKSKKTGVNAVGEAPIQSSDATVGDDTSTALDDCDEDEKAEDEKVAEVEDDEDDEDVESDDKAPVKEKAKGKVKGKTAGKTPNECPAPGTTPAATGGAASLVEGQKIYAANCQGCHGTLPGQKQGAPAETILSASTLGTHKGVSPWPAAQASALSAQDAAASLAEAMK